MRDFYAAYQILCCDPRRSTVPNLVDLTDLAESDSPTSDAGKRRRICANDLATARYRCLRRARCNCFLCPLLGFRQSSGSNSAAQLSSVARSHCQWCALNMVSAWPQAAQPLIVSEWPSCDQLHCNSTHQHPLYFLECCDAAPAALHLRSGGLPSVPWQPNLRHGASLTRPMPRCAYLCEMARAPTFRGPNLRYLVARDSGPASQAANFAASVRSCSCTYLTTLSMTAIRAALLSMEHEAVLRCGVAYGACRELVLLGRACLQTLVKYDSRHWILLWAAEVSCGLPPVQLTSSDLQALLD